MNSLNILSGRVSPPQSAAPSRSNSFGNALTLSKSDTNRHSREDVEKENVVDNDDTPNEAPADNAEAAVTDEKMPLLGDGSFGPTDPKSQGWYLIPNRIASALITSLRWVVNAIVAPGVYLVSCLYDEEGHFSPLSQFHKIGDMFWTPPVDPLAEAYENSTLNGNRILLGKAHERAHLEHRGSVSTRRHRLSTSSSSAISDSESEKAVSDHDQDSPASLRHTRSKSLQNTDEIAPARRSIRIKLHNEDSLRQRKQHRKTQSTNSQSNGSGAVSVGEISPATLKSPTSPASSLLLTKYPRAPAPPRPLIPRRLPSYTLPEGGAKPGQKTLILDLDETLIHSMAKGGRMSTGHMVEVNLNTYIGVGGQPSIGPQHPILYYVHKRPHCDDFLRRVCQWYNLVIFTASVQEYADPVIDWLERERKFFSGRFYRQHCTYRHGAFIKDLSSVEPDLSKVMILDNSPLSYMFHQDNAIPIEGWINDPTDNDLIHLIPLLEGLQYVTDVRALLALRGGEDGKHMA